MLDTDADLIRPYLPRLKKLCSELDQRGVESRFLNGYDAGNCPLPRAIVESRLTKAYRMLMPMSEAPWGSLVVGSSLDRLEISGVKDTDKAVADRAWGAWQDNQMDAESRLLHHSTLVTGRAFAIVWGSESDGTVPEISLDGSDQTIVQYREGSRRHRAAALRRWVDEDGRAMATLYLPDRICKFQAPEKGTGAAVDEWEIRRVEDEDWPLGHDLGSVPVVELAINRRLKPGAFGYARGEYAHCTGLIDRINLLTFLGLVVAFWMGFPLRAVIGDKILRDDDGNALPPFEVNADSVAQFEDPGTRLDSFPAADRGNLAIYSELDQLATITRTPRHYFPLEGGMSNIAADTIRANEGALHAKISGDYKPSLGEGWEEVLRLCTLIQGGTALSPRAELQWKDHESRSLAERADAATKLASIPGFPWAAVAEIALNAGPDQIARWDSEAAGSVIGQLLRDAQTAPAVA